MSCDKCNRLQAKIDALLIVNTEWVKRCEKYESIMEYYKGRIKELEEANMEYELENEKLHQRISHLTAPDLI